MAKVIIDGVEKELTSEIARQLFNSLDNQDYEPLEFDGITTVEMDANKVLKAAIDKLDRCLIIGTTKKAELYCASTTSDIGTLFVDMELAKQELLSCIEDENE